GPMAGRGGPGGGARPEPGRAADARHADWYRGGWADSRGATSSNPRDVSSYRGGSENSRGSSSGTGRDASSAYDKARDYIREERARDYAAGLSWGLGWGSSGSGSGSDSGSDSGSGYGNGTGYTSNYGTGYGNSDSDTSSAAAGQADTNAPQDGATAQGEATDSGSDGANIATDSASGANRAYQTFQRAREAFKAGDYASALKLTDEALENVPGDALIHEFQALVLFARGDVARADDVLHAVLALTPGMNWSTLIWLYTDVETYTAQLRSLEERRRQDPRASAPRFVLAYHYLAAGHKDAAVTELKAVLASEPGDRVARRLLASLTCESPAPTEPSRVAPGGDAAPGPRPSADLHGRWKGERDGSTFDLTLDDRGRFLWRAARDGKATANLSGAYTLSGDTLTLRAEDRPPLRVSVTESTPDSFRWKPAGDTHGDPGLGFRRVVPQAAPKDDRPGRPHEGR
ncbi:MAG TPA: tetratricopeptide repeat protein, partial [Isosphaeraceae bacterium]